MLRKEML